MSAELISSQLSEYLRFKNGKSSPDRDDDALFPVYGSNGLIGHADKINSDQNTIIIGRVGSYCGSVHFSDKPCWVSDNAIICTSKNPEDSLFWYYFLKFSDLNQYRSGSGQPLLNQGTLNSISCEVPRALTERVRIGELLASYDKKQGLNHQINQTLEQMAQAIFKSWFVDFEPVKAKIATLEAGGSKEDALLAAMQAISGKDEAQLPRLQAEKPEQYAELRATAELFPSAMQDSELGEIPEGWRQRQVGELATIKGGKQRSRDLISNIGPVPVFGGAGIMGYTDEHNADGFVISVGRVGAYCGQFFSHRGPSWVNNNASLIRPSNINHGEWLFIALQNIDLAPIKKGAAQPFVSNSDLAKLQVVWPGDMVIEKFTQQLRNLFLLQETLLQQSDSLSTLRDTLLPELLAGRLDTSVIGS